MSKLNFPIKNLSVRFSREQKVFQQLTNKDALIDALISLYNNTAKCQNKDPQELATSFVQLYKPICHEINKSRVSLKDFKILNKDTFVEGAFGKVTIVKSLHDKENIYAMKTLNKSHLIKQAGRSSPMEERLVLSNEDEEWLPKLYASFQDSENLYLVMEYAHGGDLENLMGIRDYKLNEDEARFYCAELILAIERVHELGYMHRDIKPANILIDSKGHIKLGDLGCCISIDTTDSLFPVGTAAYMSPEMSDSTFGTTTYGPEADWWSVGIILYELLYGVTPFTGKVSDIQKSLMNPKVKFNDEITVSEEAKDLISKLLLKSKADRLGVKGGASEIKSHSFFKDINWKTLRKEVVPPFIPSIKSLDDTTFFAATNAQEEGEEDEDFEEDDESDDEEDDAYRDFPFIGYSYACSLLHNVKSPAENKEDKKIGDNKAFLAQFRQKMTQPADLKHWEEEKSKLQQQYDLEIAGLKALLDVKSSTMDNMHQQMEEEKGALNLLHNEEVAKLNALIDDKDMRIKYLEAKVTTLEAVHDDRTSTSSKKVLELNSQLEDKNQQISELQSKNNTLEISNKKLESSLDDLLDAQTKLESSLKILSIEKQELESGLKQVREQMKSQNDTVSDSWKQELNDSRNEVLNLNSQMEEKTESLEAKNKELHAENRDLHDQLLELENHVDKLNKKLIEEANKTKDLVLQFEKKLNDQSNDYEMVIKQTKAECMELKDELSNLQHQSSTATRMKRAAKSLPNIPSNSSPKLLPSAEYSPGEGRSLILSSMWQRDRESLRNVQQALEDSESKLAFAKRQVIRLKKEIKCFQKYTFEQQQRPDKLDTNTGNIESSDYQNKMDYSFRRPLNHKRMNSITFENNTVKKCSPPITPPQNAADYSPTINRINSFSNEFGENKEEVLDDHTIFSKLTNGSQFEQETFTKSTIGDSDMAILKEIKREQNFINSTKRTMAARLRLSRSRSEIDQELEKSIELSTKKIAALQSKLKKPMSMSYSPKDFLVNPIH